MPIPFRLSSPSHFLFSHMSMAIQVIQTETRDPLRERQNLVQRWCFFLFFLVVHFVFLNTNHRSVSDKTPRGGKPKILRNRLQSEDQVRLLFLKQAFLVCQCSGELSCADPSSGKKAQPQVGRSDEPAQGDRTSLSQSCRLFSTWPTQKLSVSG